MCVDNCSNLRKISEVAVAHDVVLGVIVELDVGQNRCGVDTESGLIKLAQLADNLPGVQFEGIQVCAHGRIRIQ